MQSASLSTEGVGPAGGGTGDAQHGVGQRVGGGGVGPRSKCQEDIIVYRDSYLVVVSQYTMNLG